MPLIWRSNYTYFENGSAAHGFADCSGILLNPSPTTVNYSLMTQHNVFNKTYNPAGVVEVSMVQQSVYGLLITKMQCFTVPIR